MMGTIAKFAGNQYIWFAVIVGVLWGAYKWEKHKVASAELKAVGITKSLTLAINELDDAARINKSALDELASQAREVERQKLIAAAEAKKSRQRLDAFNALNRKIGNVPTSENVPVSNHLELLLDAQRVRGAVAEPSGSTADSSNESGVSGTSGPLGPVVSPTASPTS